MVLRRGGRHVLGRGISSGRFSRHGKEKGEGEDAGFFLEKEERSFKGWKGLTLKKKSWT